MKKVVLFLLTTVCVYAQSNGDILNERYEEIRESYLTGNKYDCGAFFDAMRKAKAEGMSKYREFIYKYKEQEVFRVCFHLDRVDKYNAEHNQYNLIY
jgi:K+-transporting ATPase c subunit